MAAPRKPRTPMRPSQPHPSKSGRPRRVREAGVQHKRGSAPADAGSAPSAATRKPPAAAAAAARSSAAGKRPQRPAAPPTPGRRASHQTTVPGRSAGRRVRVQERPAQPTSDHQRPDATEPSVPTWLTSFLHLFTARSPHMPAPAAAVARSTVRRMRGVFIGMLVALSLVGAQLFKLQVIDAAANADQARLIRSVSAKLEPRRGDILDVHGAALAATLQRYTVQANQQALGKEPYWTNPTSQRREPITIPEVAALLAPHLKMPEATLVTRLSGDLKWRVLKKGIEPLTWRRIQELSITGISAEADPRRDYPIGAAAAPTVGWFNSSSKDDQGHIKVSGGGIEAMANVALVGTRGKKMFQQAADGKEIPQAERVVVPAVDGSTVRTTLDADLINYSYQALEKAVKETKADWATAVVLDTRDGSVRALAQYPSFDPVKRTNLSHMGNKVFHNAYEPGSTVKAMTIGAALQEKVTQPTSVHTVPNRLSRAGGTFKDSHDHPTQRLTTAGVLALSSNIGTALVGEKMPKETLYRYFTAFGATSRSEVGFPGESAGLLHQPQEWSGSQRYTVMYGQGVSMTAIQVASVFQTIANGGVRMPVSLITETVSPSGEVTRPEASQATRVLSPEVAAHLTTMMEAVVTEDGTAQQAHIPGFRVAGKTGTADRFDPTVGGYRGKTASFVGYAPADQPRYVVSVVVDHPKNGYFGGSTAGPVFRSIMQYALKQAGIEPTSAAPTLFPLEEGKAPPKLEILKPTSSNVSKKTPRDASADQRG